MENETPLLERSGQWIMTSCATGARALFNFMVIHNGLGCISLNRRPLSVYRTMLPAEEDDLLNFLYRRVQGSKLYFAPNADHPTAVWAAVDIRGVNLLFYPNPDNALDIGDAIFLSDAAVRELTRLLMERRDERNGHSSIPKVTAPSFGL